jgi:hypothetical protein
MRVPESRARRYNRERSYSYLVQPVKKVDKRKITKDEFRKLMQKVKEDTPWARIVPPEEGEQDG